MTHIESDVHPFRFGPVFSSVALALSWAWILGGAGTGMSVWAMTTWAFPPGPEGMAMPADWNLQYAMLMLLMWATMMWAMMLPGVLLSFASQRKLRHLSSQFMVTYLAGWLLFSVLATGLQFAFETLGWLDGMLMWSVNSSLSYSLLAVVAGFQILLLFRILRSSSTTGKTGEVSATRYASNCLTSTGPVMLLLFVGGVMNIVWIIGLSAWAALQKLNLNPVVAPASALALCLAAGAAIYLKTNS